MTGSTKCLLATSAVSAQGGLNYWESQTTFYLAVQYGTSISALTTGQQRKQLVT
jgi:hypothetical protein